MIKIINDNGRIWCVVVEASPQEKIEKYAFAAQGTASFYDCRYEYTNYGQFVSRYYVSTLLENNQQDCGLDLQGDVPAWKISKEGMDRVRAFLSTISAIAKAEGNEINPLDDLKYQQAARQWENIEP